MPSAEEIERSRRESLDAIRRVDRMRSHSPTESVETVAAFEPRIERTETTNQRHAREITEQEEKFAQERREREQQQERTQREQQLQDEIDGLIAQSTVIEQLLHDGLHASSQFADAVERELRELRLQVTESETRSAQLEAEVAKLKLQIIEVGAGKAIDLPALPTRMQ
ncbi:hypothetical protein [Bradyrhizobium sp. Cp5.3]|uniref:hypothetical protein n=1 Tax=Bradyrhizobium sp. Cp5.3 TaxID=443598 RepID=UPI00041FE0FD|nr:hypothetical protein [Bradyrhizobium sp. Cp5.3]